MLRGVRFARVPVWVVGILGVLAVATIAGATSRAWATRPDGDVRQDDRWWCRGSHRLRSQASQQLRAGCRGDGHEAVRLPRTRR